MCIVKTSQLTIPEDVAEELDKIAKPRGRSKFIVTALREKLDRIRFDKAVEESLSFPGWNDAAHPELREGAAAYIEGLRQGIYPLINFHKG